VTERGKKCKITNVKNPKGAHRKQNFYCAECGAWLALRVYGGVKAKKSPVKMVVSKKRKRK